MIKNTLFISIALLSGSVLANEANHAAVTNIPVESIIKQLINFSLFMAGVIYLIVKRLIPQLKQKALSYDEAVNRAQKEKALAEQKVDELRAKLEKLEKTSVESVRQAVIDANQLREQITQEATAQAAKFRAEAESTIKQDLLSAKTKYRDLLLNEATELAQKKLGSGLSQPDKKRLQSEFVEKIQVVQ